MAGSHRVSARRYLREWAAAALFLATAGIGLYIYCRGPDAADRQVLRITGGSQAGARAMIASRLAVEAAAQGLTAQAGRLRRIERRSRLGGTGIDRPGPGSGRARPEQAPPCPSTRRRCTSSRSTCW